ncbi:TIGR03915 family putative DNA repair protein [Gorillibacterium sp. CAU 1737]|uniref:TIGR03915 family putative DNA repair protein n=1 Tax=Gorillibacterium sp. CAU 1737 TaxID=3140362 RepID=UPI0032612AAE
MLDRTDVVFLYDGTYEGLLTCVFESYARKILPLDILSESSEEGLLFDTVYIETEGEKARRVETGIRTKLGEEALGVVRDGCLTCHPHKELLLLRYIRLGFQKGRSAFNRLAEEPMHSLNKAVQNLRREAHLYTGFVRFASHGQVLIAEIEPENQVLPVIADHFSDRFSGEAFLIHDRTHRRALVHRPNEYVIMDVDELTLPSESPDEGSYRAMWQRFYETIAIQARVNPRGRMNHMPKRFWKLLPEMESARIAEAAERYTVSLEDKGRSPKEEEQRGQQEENNR